MTKNTFIAIAIVIIVSLFSVIAIGILILQYVNFGSHLRTPDIYDVYFDTNFDQPSYITYDTFPENSLDSYTYEIDIPMEDVKPRTVVPTMINLQVNENSIELAANNIDGSNYFRITDIEYAMRTTEKYFDSAQTLPYLTGYSVNGYDYFSIREISDLIGFRTFWIGTRNTIIIDTSSNYSLAGSDNPIFTMEPLPEYIKEIIRGSSFHDTTPFSYCFLTYLTITHVDFYGKYRLGNMIVAAEIGEEVLDIFREIFEYRFPISRMRLIDFYSASDYLSMADNNSVGFNFRYIAGTRILSRHALGRAIDINPIQNPYIRGNTIWPPAGASYADRENIRPGMIIRGDIVYQAFISRGWIWGGNWRVPRDYHHFERP